MSPALARVLGNRLRELRESRGLILKDLERISGISSTHISEIERGKTSPTISVLERISKALGTPISYLLELLPVDVLQVTTRQERSVLADADRLVLVQRLSEAWWGNELTLKHLRIKPAGILRGEAPPSEDLVLVHRGSVGVRIGQDWHYLDEGDTLHLLSR